MQTFTANGVALKAGRTQRMTGRYLRLNYLIGPNNPVHTVPNILLVKVRQDYVKLHEGEVIDLGEVAGRDFEFDFFQNQFPGILPANIANFELQMSDFPMDTMAQIPRRFIDGIGASLSAGTLAYNIKGAPNYVPLANGKLVPVPLIKHVRIVNNSANPINLNDTYTGNTWGVLAANGVYEEDHTADLTLNYTGGGLTNFFYTVHFEWV